MGYFSLFIKVDIIFVYRCDYYTLFSKPYYYFENVIKLIRKI